MKNQLFRFVIVFAAALVQADGTSFPLSETTPDAFHPCDAVLIRVYPDTAIFPNGIYPIGSDGIARLPMIGPVVVTNITPDSLVRFITPAYTPYVRNTIFETAPLLRISLQGGFHSPGLYWFSPRENIWRVLERAGGTLREDGFRKLQWIRDGKVEPVVLEPLVQDGKSLYELGFRSGDQIWVTPNPLRTGWEIFRQDALPILTFIMASVTTGIIIHNFYEQQ